MKAIFACCLLLAALLSGCVTVRPGEAGLLWRPLTSGLGKKTIEPGLYSVAPWNDIIRYDMQLQALQESVIVLTDDDLKIRIVASLIVRPKRGELYQLEREMGRRYARKVVRPKFRTAIRNVLAKYPMVRISKNTRKIERELKRAVKNRLKGRHIYVHDVIVDDIKFSALVLQAIETKLAKEQRQKQMRFEINIARKDAEIRMIRAKAEANAQRERAKGQADAQRLLDKSLTNKILQLKAFESRNSKFFFMPSGKTGLPLMINPR